MTESVIGPHGLPGSRPEFLIDQAEFDLLAEAHAFERVELHDTGLDPASPPPANYEFFYVKSGVLYTMDSSGTVTAVGGSPTGAAGGDLGGTYPNPTVNATHAGSAHHNRSHSHADPLDGSTLSPAILNVPTAASPTPTAAGRIQFDTVTGRYKHGDGSTTKTVVDVGDAITSALAGGNWKVLYTNGSGTIVELALAAAGRYLKANGVSAAPTFAVIAPTELVGGTWKVLYLDSSGAVQELALGAAATYLRSAGASAAPTFGTIAPSELVGGNWKVLYTNGSGVVTELALGAAGKYLRAGGASSAPTFANVDYSELTGTVPSKVVRVSHTWTVPDTIAVPSGDTDFIPPMFVSFASGQTGKLVACKYIINSGTSVTAKLQVNGSDATGFTGISVTTTAGSTDPTDVTLADGDKIALVVTAVSGTPKNMSFSIFLEYTV